MPKKLIARPTVVASLASLLAVLALVPAACGDDPDPGEGAGPADATTTSSSAADQLDAIAAAVDRWASASDLTQAKAAAEEARNLVTGPDTLDAGDLDGDGLIAGDTGDAGEVGVGLLPGEDGRAGLAQPLAGCELVDRDVLGGSWDDPAARWMILADAIAAWAPDNNTFPTLPSHPQRIVGWASLTLATDSLDEALEYAGHAGLHVDVSRTALQSCA